MSNEHPQHNEPWKNLSSPIQSAALQSYRILKIIQHLHVIRLETINRFNHRGRGFALEPRRAAPGVLVRHRHQSVPDRVLVDIIQAGKIAFLVGQTRLPKIVPDLPSLDSVQTVHPSRTVLVKIRQKPPQRFRSISRSIRRMTDEMIMIRKHCPGLQAPAIFRRITQQSVMQRLQPSFSGKEVLFPMRSRRNNERSGLIQPMLRRMRPTWSAALRAALDFGGSCVRHHHKQSIHTGHLIQTKWRRKFGVRRLPPLYGCERQRNFADGMPFQESFSIQSKAAETAALQRQSAALQRETAALPKPPHFK